MLYDSIETLIIIIQKKRNSYNAFSCQLNKSICILKFLFSQNLDKNEKD